MIINILCAFLAIRIPVTSIPVLNILIILQMDTRIINVYVEVVELILRYPLVGIIRELAF
jgi:hypothetical protein